MLINSVKWVGGGGGEDALRSVVKVMYAPEEDIHQPTSPMQEEFYTPFW